MRGRLLYDYVNNTGSGKTLTIELILGATVIASQAVPTTSSASNRLGELEFVVGDTIASNFQNGGFRGVHGDPGGPIPLMAVGTGGENVGVSLPIQIRVTHGVASPDLVFRTLLVVLELV
ncbi:MAG: hypothetical protein HYY12_01990 [Candidatus Methylomirabilis oxyfera]|nr:hypothetical protein [Candidatus Methylomirabilis oxyfera]